MAGTHDFDPGYGQEPFATLVREYPGEDVYPTTDFRTEWGPIFHRGRLDGSARLIAIGQDPAAHEDVVRRILVGEAGQRVQGFLAKLGVTRSYAMVNTFLYSVLGNGGAAHVVDPGVSAYRNRWLDALLTGPGNRVQAVVGFGSLAEKSWRAWKKTPNGKASTLPFAEVTHPTAPSRAKGAAAQAAATTALLASWNAGLQALAPALTQPDEPRPLALYGTAFADGDLQPIPDADFPAGLPPFMRSLDEWATRAGTTPALKRVTIQITIPGPFRP